jgi:DNA-binding MarR family transcriptional regulator
MSLEQDIKQKAFSSEIEKAIVNINFTHSYFAGLLNSSLKQHNISIQQFNVLRILKGSHPKPVSVNDITDRMIDKMSNASRLVEKLRLKGLISRNTCLFDKRQVDVSITEEGQDLLKKLNELTLEVIAGHSHLSDQELVELNATLDKIRKK